MTGPVPNRMGQDILKTGGLIVDFTPPGGAFNTPVSAFGFVLFDGVTFLESIGADDPSTNPDLRGRTDPQVSGPKNPHNEDAEETWIDENSTPLIVNRYNGTLIRAE